MNHLSKKMIFATALWATVFPMMTPVADAAEQNSAYSTKFASVSDERLAPLQLGSLPVGDSWMDVAYGDAAACQKLDIYLPAKGVAPFPVIMAFHSADKDKSSDEMLCPLMGLKHGYAVVCVNYREDEARPIFTSLADAKAVVRFLRANAKKYKLDTSRMAALGAAEGGMLASLLGITSGRPELEDFSLGDKGQSSRINAVVALYPSFEMLEGKGIVSPVNYVGPDAASFMFLHGTKETQEALASARELADKIRHNIGSKKVKWFNVNEAGREINEYMKSDTEANIFRFLDNRLRTKIKRDKKK